MPEGDIAAAREARTTEVMPGARRSRSHIATTIFLCLALALFVIKLQKGLQLTANDWNLSEWLIDYANGFVRRGLGGTILLFLHHKTGIDVTTFVIAFTAVIYCILFIIFVHRVYKTSNSTNDIWRYVILYSPNLILFAITSGFFFRKDLPFVFFTISNMILAEFLLIRCRKKHLHPFDFAMVCAAAGLPAVFLAGIHEGLFLFDFLPVNVLIWAAAVSRSASSDGNGRRIPAFALAAAIFIPSLVVAGLSIIRHGDPQTAEAICLSWQGTARGVDCSREMPAAVMAIGWEFGNTLGTSATLFRDGGTFYYALAFLALSLIQLAAVAFISENAKPELHATIIAALFIAALPLFVIGADLGRFFFIMSMQTTFLMLSAPMRDAVGEYLPPSLLKPAHRLLADRRVAATMRLISRHPRAICIGFIFLGLPAAQMTPHAALAQSAFSIIVHVFHPSFGIE